jgi:CheY-like chemotaxis protein
VLLLPTEGLDAKITAFERVLIPLPMSDGDVSADGAARQPAPAALPQLFVPRFCGPGRSRGVFRQEGLPPQTATEEAMTDYASTPRRLLVIEDDPIYRTAMMYLLHRLGHMADVAENGFAGLALLGQQAVDLVLTDLLMPGLTGWDVARLAKTMHPRLPVVLVTGAADTIAPDQPERTWVDAILGKPFGVAAMQTVIGTLTQDRPDSVGSGGSKRPGLTPGNGRPTSAPVVGSGVDPPVAILPMPPKRRGP